MPKPKKDKKGGKKKKKHKRQAREPDGPGSEPALTGEAASPAIDAPTVGDARP